MLDHVMLQQKINRQWSRNEPKVQIINAQGPVITYYRGDRGGSVIVRVVLDSQ